MIIQKKKTDQAGQTDQSSWSQQLQQSDDYISSELQKPGMVIRTYALKQMVRRLSGRKSW